MRLVDAFSLVSIGKRLAPWLVLVGAYGVADWFAIRWWNLQLFSWGSTAELINGILLGLLMSFRNSAAYQRWWEARGLWGQLTNDDLQQARGSIDQLVGLIQRKTGSGPVSR